MRSGSLASRNGRRYLSTAVSTTRARWVKVSQPRPYRPGSLVSTLTTTRRLPAGAVRTVLTSVIFSAGNRFGGSDLSGLGGWPPGAPAAAGLGVGESQFSPARPPPSPAHCIHVLRFTGTS